MKEELCHADLNYDDFAITVIKPRAKSGLAKYSSEVRSPFMC